MREGVVQITVGDSGIVVDILSLLMETERSGEGEGEGEMPAVVH